MSNELMKWADVERTQLTAARNTAQVYPLNSDAERDALLRDAQTAKTRMKQLKEMKASIVEPLKASMKATSAIFDPAIEAAEAIVDTIKDRVLQYGREQTARVMQARADAQAALTAAQTTQPAQGSPPWSIGPQAPTQAAPPVSTFAFGALESVAVTPIDVAGVHGRKTYRAVVTDEAAVPREYLIVDQTTLNRIARESKGNAVVPGVRFEAVDGLAIGGA